MDGPTVRTHGFQRPFHPLQVLSWVVFGTDVFVYAVFALPLVETVGAKVVVALCYIVSVIVVVIATAKATSCDPADPHVLSQEIADKAEDVDTMPFCTMCNVPVHPRSKHCRACNKCVSTFDHHCMWLNNCIGADNYRAFFVTILSVAIMIGIILGTTLYLMIDYFANENGFDDRRESSSLHKQFPREFYLGLFVVLIAVNGPLYLLDMQLVLLHTFLASQNMTTYEYIMNKRSNENDQASGGLGRRFRTLPSCMDWIVFSRCGQKRRKKKGDIERIDRNRDGMEGSASAEAKAGDIEATMGHIAKPGMVTGTVQTGSAADPPDGSKSLDMCDQKAEAFREPVRCDGQNGQYQKDSE
jgi:hypothetical protein